ncbi:hypothetical protein SMICM17S_10582 [Streptomyces microflavus]
MPVRRTGSPSSHLAGGVRRAGLHRADRAIVYALGDLVAHLAVGALDVRERVPDDDVPPGAAFDLLGLLQTSPLSVWTMVTFSTSCALRVVQSGRVVVLRLQDDFLVLVRRDLAAAGLAGLDLADRGEELPGQPAGRVGARHGPLGLLVRGQDGGRNARFRTAGGGREITGRTGPVGRDEGRKVGVVRRVARGGIVLRAARLTAGGLLVAARGPFGQRGRGGLGSRERRHGGRRHRGGRGPLAQTSLNVRCHTFRSLPLEGCSRSPAQDSKRPYGTS